MEHEKIYIDTLNGIVKIVNKVQELNDTQVLIESYGRFEIIHKNDIVDKQEYDRHIEAMYNGILNGFRKYIKDSRDINKSLLLRMINDLVKEKFIKED